MPIREKDEARKEVAVLAQMQHPNIVSYIDSFEGFMNISLDQPFQSYPFNYNINFFQISYLSCYYFFIFVLSFYHPTALHLNRIRTAFKYISQFTSKGQVFLNEIFW